MKRPRRIRKRRKGEPTKGLELLFQRQDGLCYYCRRLMRLTLKPVDSQATRDHVVPRCQGGGKVVAACRECNHRKGSMSEAQYRALLAWQAQAES